MSLAAMLWALHEAEVPDPIAKLVLLCLADHADPDGEGAYPSQASIALTVPCDRATVQRKLADLAEAGLLFRGDQGLVAHYAANRRPVVYDLALPRLGPHSAAPEPVLGPQQAPFRGRTGAAAVRHKPYKPKAKPRGAARGETDDGAVLGCADHAPHRSPACAECQRVQPPAKADVRPVDPTVIDRLRGRTTA